MEASHLTKALRHVLGGLSGPDGAADAQLLERYVARHDEAAFTALVQRHGPMVFRLCQRMLANRADAEDVFQATFVVLARRAAAIVKRPSLASWLHGVARRVARDVRCSASRRRAREQSLGDAADDIADRPVRAGPSEGDLRPILDEELGRLPERYRAPMVLYYLEGRSTDEVATELGVARGTIASRMSRGRDLLRSRLARRGLAIPAAAFAAQLAESTAGAAIPAATLNALIPAGLIAGTVSERVALLAKGVLDGMVWAKLRWGGLLICLLLLGTATVKWAVSAGKPAGNAKGSTERGDDFYVRWRFDNGPPKDIRVFYGNWQWLSEKGKPALMAAPDVSLLFPPRVPRRPFVLSVKVSGWDSRAPLGCSAFWADGDRIVRRQHWFTEGKITKGCWFNAYFMDRWMVAVCDRLVYRVHRYDQPWPGQYVAFHGYNMGIEEIQLRSLRQGEIPAALRNAEQTIKTMKTGPYDRPDEFIPPAK